MENIYETMFSNVLYMDSKYNYIKHTYGKTQEVYQTIVFVG